MKQFTTPEQTVKMIELELLPKHIQKISDDGKLLLECVGYSVGELIEILPKVVEDEDSEYATISIYHDTISWVIDYQSPERCFYSTSNIELVDALYEMIIKLKNEKLI